MSFMLDPHSSFSLIEACMSQELADSKQWSDLDQAFKTLYQTCNSILEAKELNEQLVTLLGEDNLMETVQGHAIRKPYGRGGDFELIDQIYQQQIHENPTYGKWDRFCHSSEAAIAIRKRKTYFKQCLKQCQRIDRNLSVLHLGGGSGREILEYFEEAKPSTTRVQLDVVTRNEKAIDFASKLNQAYLGNIHFHKQHAFRFKPSTAYDLIWGGAICDYLDDEHVVFFLSKMREWIDVKGQIVLTSFSTHNPSRAYMELMMDWYIYHRSAQDWNQLARWSGYYQEDISIKEDAMGVHLTLKRA